MPESWPEMTANADLVPLCRQLIWHIASLGGDGMSRHRTIRLISRSTKGATRGVRPSPFGGQR